LALKKIVVDGKIYYLDEFELPDIEQDQNCLYLWVWRDKHWKSGFVIPIETRKIDVNLGTSENLRSLIKDKILDTENPYKGNLETLAKQVNYFMAGFDWSE
jgi:hypothetical protein